MSYVAVYWAISGTLLGAVPRSASSRFSHREDAEALLEAALEINRSAGIECSGQVRETAGAPEILRHCDGAEAQAVGGRCPRCREVVS